MTVHPSGATSGPSTSQLPVVEPQTIPDPTVTQPGVAPERTQEPTSEPARTQAVPLTPPAPPGPIRPAKGVRRPLGALPALIPGVILALVAVGLGVVGIHDAIIHWTRSGSWDLISISGPTWTGRAIRSIENLTPHLWMSFAGVAVALLGIWLVVLALKPRRVRGVAVSSSTYMWVEHAGIGRLAVGAAAQVPGVRSARGSAGRRRVDVTVEAGGGDTQQLAASVRDAIAARLAPLAKAPRITVSVKQPDRPAASTPGGTT